MAVLHLALEEGFSDDAVVVAVDREEVLRAESVSTRMQIGLAQTADVTVEPGRHTVTAHSRGTSTELVVEVQDELYVGLSLDRSGAFEHRVSPTPFGYV
jgi:hypothetical protein